MSAQRTRTCLRRATTPMPRRRLPDTVTIPRTMLRDLAKLAKRNIDDLTDQQIALILEARSIARGDHETTSAPPRTRP